MTAEQTLSEILTDQMNMVSNGIDASLNEHLATMPSAPVISERTKSHIAKRVGPKSRAKYLNSKGAISLLSIEVIDLGTRISRYQYIERYREHFKSPDPEMGTAFIMHTHILRGSEIYVIMERCGSFLDFFYDLAVDLDLNPKSKLGKDLEKQFKKCFARHLRERHRIVHAHERPSVISRITAIAPEPEGEHRDLMEKVFLDAFSQIFEALTKLAPHLVDTKTGEEAIKNINDHRLKAVDRECFEMWSILLGSINKTIDSSKLLKKAQPS
ncbi:hypothetical protein PX554_01790 [Sphingomonas sp. H39-1-10]|uniref:hypothetical protein n=1 Tax=Sphingomonas pollutisoli TaxID=3030829 RepID=UPI0023B8FEF4|nr:hypothetical protein [Sphingomonas pollutisoli]MDF0486846.1 hypothetical protein [Sphingomonas pollutisoli]